MVYPLYQPIHEDLARWTAIRTYGKTRIIFIHGHLIWGCIVSLLWVFPLLLFEKHRLFVFAITLFTFPFGGYICGLIIWKYNERKLLIWKQHVTSAQIQAVENFSKDFDPTREIRNLLKLFICLTLVGLLEVFVIIPYP